MTFAAGETIGPYRIIEQIGQGGMATVFKAYHATLDRYVAVKVLGPAFQDDPNFLSRFHREARIVARLDHPSIIPIYDYAEHEGTPYLVIRYVEGKTLKTIIQKGPLPPDQVLTLMRPVTAALEYAHSQGVLHRDIKPSNIIIGDDGRPYLADFGLARMAQVSASTTSQDTMLGTPQYISPEQAKGEAVDVRSDIYSLGVVLFETLTGRVPFDANTPYAVIHDHIYTPAPLASTVNPNVPPGIEYVLFKALEKDPAARFASVADLFSALERATGLERPIVPSPTPPHSPGVFTKFLPVIIIVGALLLGVVYALAVHTSTPASMVGSVPIAVTPTGEQSTVLAAPAPLVTFTAAPTDETRIPVPSPTLAPTVLAAPVPLTTFTVVPVDETRIPVPSPTLVSTNTPGPPPTPSTVLATLTITPTPTRVAPPGMMLVSAGAFWMGASPTDGQATANEKPGHLVDLSAFDIDQFEVSNGDYAKCVAARVCSTPKGIYSPQSPQMAFGNPALEDLPVVFVTQGMASQYCIWLGKRLPFEAEWEKAARGSADQRIYPWGNTWEGEKANAGQPNSRPVPVSTYAGKGCSPLGICNMSGNVAEWIADFYSTNFYADSARSVIAPSVIHNPVNWDSGSGRFVIRGGSFKSNPFDARISRRDARSGADVEDDVGLRCAKSIPSP